jgi:uncharacterized protein (DUF362 family)
MQKTVKIQRVQENTAEILKEAVKTAGLRGKQRVYVKPNMSHPEYLPGVVTCPGLISEMVGLLRDGNDEVIVGESNGFNYPCQGAFEKTGIEAAVKKAGGSVINLSEDKVVKVFYRLYMIIKPQLTVMDARVAIEGNGPTKGDPVKMGLMLTSNCALATDIVASRIMGFNLEEISYLNYIARKTGLQLDEIKVEGTQVSEVARKFSRPIMDLPVKAQILIYRHEFLTKVLFCSLGFVRLLQKVTLAYSCQSKWFSMFLRARSPISEAASGCSR